MSPTGRWVVLGTAPVRAPWFAALARWATAGTVPVEFLKCLSTDEVASRLASGRRVSAVLVDGHAPGLDRDLLALAQEAGALPVVVTDAPPRWEVDGATTLPASFDRAALVSLLTTAATPVDTVVGPRPTTAPASGPWRGALLAVTGVPGSGRSTVAMGLAQGLAHDPRRRGTLALADLCLDADLAVLHDTRSVTPGVQELVEAHRSAGPGPAVVRTLLHADERRGYDLLVGLRRHRDWTVLRPAAVRAAVEGLLASYRLVVAEVDADLEGVEATGSADVEERNVLARTAVARAHATVVVGRFGVQGLHRLARVLAELLDGGHPGDRLVPVVVGTPRGPRRRAEVTEVLAALTRLPADATPFPSPVHLAHRPRLERDVRDAVPLPDTWAAPVVAAAEAALDRHGPRAVEPDGRIVAPGSLGHHAAAEPIA